MANDKFSNKNLLFSQYILPTPRRKSISNSIFVKILQKVHFAQTNLIIMLSAGSARMNFKKKELLKCTSLCEIRMATTEDSIEWPWIDSTKLNEISTTEI